MVGRRGRRSHPRNQQQHSHNLRSTVDQCGVLQHTRVGNFDHTRPAWLSLPTLEDAGGGESAGADHLAPREFSCHYYY